MWKLTHELYFIVVNHIKICYVAMLGGTNFYPSFNLNTARGGLLETWTNFVQYCKKILHTKCKSFMQEANTIIKGTVKRYVRLEMQTIR
jgi:hypothetical protein